MTLPFATVGGKVTAALYNALVNILNVMGSTRVIPTSTSSGVTVGAFGKVTVAPGTAGPINLDGLTGYENYEIVGKAVLAAGAGLTVGLRTVALTTDTTTNYDTQEHFGNTSTTSAVAALAGTSWVIGTLTTKHTFRMLLIALGLAEPTDAIIQAHDYNQASGFNGAIYNLGAGHRLSTAYGGVAIALTASTFSGAEFWIKGLND